ncbi:MAG: hypothetical protein QOD99_3209 [Chthoniobacter sp.]|jgi:tetratricopeptide (TPR) repeat protein|nr:hypothetical protein [Chthoniobacter sp.]
MAMVVMSGTAPAQETITTRDGKTQEAKILSVSPAGVKIQMAAGSMSIPLANIASVKMAPPPEFAAGMTAYEAHDFQKALSNIKSVVDKYKGLPADWAQQASGMLGDIYVALNKLPEAEAAYSESQKLNPGGGSVQAEIGLARIAVSKKDLAGAKQKIAPIVAKALQEKSVPKNLAAAYSQAFYVSGQVKEASGDFTGALEDYLRTVTLFPADRLAVNAAQERADAMRKEHGVAVP